ncbi:uncharacterized protein LOC114748879 isoform X2 [Neltuma alba]|uniref:uncharacterized protein LOC114736394 isoform X2 n=1 Tax=Neltuma alba TaxID=207710 RepID=UPI0010A548BF|nr:uncharacterized protein LOC114736394 isoform X2 [Prosopis alba]XP_028793185.1 uncharacterized protein LOC114748879 isoform X2 [Prosopis alba]
MLFRKSSLLYHSLSSLQNLAVVILSLCGSMNIALPTKAFAWTLIMSILILTLVISLSFAESSSSCASSTCAVLHFATTMVGNRAPSMASSTKVRKFGEASVGTVVESARKVPTGPDPLHHNKNPTGPCADISSVRG